MRKVSPVTGQPDYPGEGWVINYSYLDEKYTREFGGDWHTGDDLCRSDQRCRGKPVFAAADGAVIWTSDDGSFGFGRLIAIRHTATLITRYAHLDRIDVQRGDAVQAGQQIGILGNTGRSTGPHLHFDIRRGVSSNVRDWPGRDRELVVRNYVKPADWYQESPIDMPLVITPTTSEWRYVTAALGLNVRNRPSQRGKKIGMLSFRTIIELKPERVQAEGFTWREMVNWTAPGQGSAWVAEEFTAPLDIGVGTHTVITTPIKPLEPSEKVIITTAGVRVGLIGVHASAGGWPPQSDEIALVRENKVQSVFIAAYEGGQAQSAVASFRAAGVKDFIIRAATHRPISANADDFISDTLPRLREYYDALGPGTPFLVAVHNEPNALREGWLSAWNDGFAFSEWYARVVAAYRASLPGVLIGFPALSPGGVARGVREDEWAFIGGCATAIAISDWVGVHAYFVGDGSDVDLKPERWRQMAQGKPVIITEAGPADGVPNSGRALCNMYARCAEAGFPAMAWVLSGAGAWESADWVKTGARLSEDCLRRLSR